MFSIEINKSNSDKVSTVFLDYAEPYLALILKDTDNVTSELMDNILTIPWIIWNTFYFQKSGIDKRDHIETMFSLLHEIPDEVKPMIDLLLLRRKNEFAKYDYTIGAHGFYIDEKTNELKFKAEARK